MQFANTPVYAGKRVLLTGHTGFKGSWLALWLAKLGANVTGYSLSPPTDPSHFEVADVAACLTQHYEADIRDAETLNAVVKQCQPDIIFHLAAQSVVRTSYQIPRETFETNVIGSIGVLEAAREYGQPLAIVMVTSDKCYENVEQVWGYREQDALGEHDPYGASKGAAEIAIRAYRHSFFPPHKLQQHGVRLASVRAGNVIGGGDWTKDALIVDVVDALHRQEPVRLRNPKALRPWQHVLQCLSGYLTAGARLLSPDPEKYCTAWNIGPLPGNEVPVAEVVRHFIEHWGHGEAVDISNPDQPAEANILRLAIDKAIWELGWTPCWDVYQTIAKTAEWYQRYFVDCTNMQAVSLAQIAEFEAELTRRSKLELSPMQPL